MSQYIYDSKTKNITPVAGLFNNPIGYPVMTGATNTEDGKGGLVPQPKIEDMNKALFGDGTYKDIENNNDSISNRWNNTKEYSVGDYCIHNNILWNCLTAHTNQTPIMDSTYWKQCNITEEMHKLNAGITFNSNEIGRLNENITINNEDIEVLEGNISKNSSAITALATSVSNNSTSISNLNTLTSQMKDTVSDAWDKTVTYGINAYCIHKNALWKCLLQHTNQEPVNGSIYWEKCTVATELSKLNSDLVNIDNKLPKFVYPEYILFTNDILEYALSFMNTNYYFILGFTNADSINVPVENDPYHVAWNYAFVTVKIRFGYLWIELDPYNSTDKAYNFYDRDTEKWNGWIIK